METVLVTGGRGFVGAPLVQHLKRQGYKIVLVTGDIQHIEEIRPFFQEGAYVVHLAAKADKARPGRENDDFFAVNVMGTLNIVRLCLKYNCKLINFTTISALTKTNQYGISKALAEELVRSFVPSYGLLAVSVRPCGIYNSQMLDRFNDPVVPWRGKWYPLKKLVELTTQIIETHDFQRGRYKVYETDLLIHRWYALLRLPGKVVRLTQRLLGKMSRA